MTRRPATPATEIIFGNGQDPRPLLRDVEIVGDIKGLLSRHTTSVGGNPLSAGGRGSISPGVG